MCQDNNGTWRHSTPPARHGPASLSVELPSLSSLNSRTGNVLHNVNSLPIPDAPRTAVNTSATSCVGMNPKRSGFPEGNFTCYPNNTT